MKTIDEMRAEIKAAHERQMEELRALDAELDAIKAAMDGEQQWPKDGDGYWYIDNDGDVLSDEWLNSDLDQNRTEFSNRFQTETEAQKHLDWLKAVAEIRRMIGDRVGNYFPAHGGNWVHYGSNPFGCDSMELALKVASSPAFKTFLGVD